MAAGAAGAGHGGHPPATAPCWGRDAGLPPIVVLLSLKTLEMRGRRDAFVVFFLGFFTLLSNFFFSEPAHGGSHVGGLVGFCSRPGFHCPHARGAPPCSKRPVRRAGWRYFRFAPIIACTVCAVPTRGAPVGACLATPWSGAAVCRTAWKWAPLPNWRWTTALPFAYGSLAGRRRRRCCFRGPVLSRFDGRRWEPAETPMNLPPWLEAALQVQGEAVDYEVTLEPASPWLMVVLEATPERPRLPGVSMAMTPDLQMGGGPPPTELARYRAQLPAVSPWSHAHDVGAVRDGAVALSAPTHAPAAWPPNCASRSAAPSASGINSQALVDAALQRLRTGGYTAALEPGIYGTHTADEFWFDRKTGFASTLRRALWC